MRQANLLVCLFFLGQLTISLSSVPPGCSSNAKNWVKVLTTNNNGNTQFGDKADLVEAVSKGSRIKIRTATYSAEVQNCRIVNQEVCCQGLLHISYQNWRIFQQNSYWWMIIVCTTGNWHIVRYFVGGNFLSETIRRGSFMWYVYKYDNDSFPDPLLSTDGSGNVLSGSASMVEDAVRDGRPLTVLQKEFILLPIQNVQLRDGKVSAQHVLSVSLAIVGNYIQFQSNAYWWFNILTPSGTRDMSRWTLGSHISRDHTNDIVAMDWFAGHHWNKVHISCTPFSELLSRLFLKYLVENGLPIRVKFENTFLEVDNVMISGDHISAQVITQLARQNATTFENDLNWEFRTLSTQGNIRTYRPLVGSSNTATVGTTVQTSQHITWYYDSRQWDLMLHISSTGTVLTGSALAVRNAVEAGADIRVGYKRNGDPGFRFQTANNVNFRPSPPHLSVQLVLLLRDINIPGDEFKLDDKPVWSFTLLNTLGFMRKTEWVVGEFDNKDRTPRERVEIKFFASM